MQRPEDIPEDVLALAEQAYAEAIYMTGADEPRRMVLMVARAIMAAKAEEREACAAYHDEWERKHIRLIEERPDDADFHSEHALRHRVHAAAIRKGAA